MIFDMERQRAFKMAAVCGIAISLQGCIVAAFPIAAGGLMAGAGRTAPGPEAEIAAAPPPVIEQQTSTAELTESSAPTIELAESGSDRATGSFSVEGETAAAPIAASSETEAFEAAFPDTAPSAEIATASPASPGGESLAAAPPPAPVSVPNPAPPQPALVIPQPAQPAQSASPAIPTQPPAATSASASSAIVVPIPAAPPAVAGGTFFDPLLAYAGAPEFARSDARTSAILRNPAMLEPDRTQCTQGVSTVLIDLDPEDRELLPIDTRSASPALADRLAQLRLRGVIIAWISGSSIDKMNDIRVALSQSGLDPLGIDEVLLMRSEDERKQSRRDELARNSCLIAIAGDARSDFHELYGYLLNPSDAASLEPLIGEGWFLIPTPLLPESSTR